MHTIWGDARPWLFSAVILTAAVFLAVLLHSLIFWVAEKFTLRRGATIQHSLVKHVKTPARMVFPLLAIVLALPLALLPDKLRDGLQHALGLAVIASIGWGFVVLTEVVSDVIFSRYSMESADNLTARRIRTQTQVIERIVVMLVAVVTLAVMLMTFPSVRNIGASVLASAGLAGLVVGMAARPTLASLIAGLQVAITQPIRIDDSIVVEGEWGWVEEIETTYVVVRLWDLRRLILPLTYFIERPFQNWTRTTSDLLGTAMIYADYSLPVEELRKELQRLLKASQLWDGKTWGLQVTDLTERTMQIRALMSASNASKAFDLRCYVREKLIEFLQEKYPQCLPQRRENLLLDSGPQQTPDDKIS
jgi:small-conductance mechanosensitive channel